MLSICAGSGEGDAALDDALLIMRCAAGFIGALPAEHAKSMPLRSMA